MRDAGYKGGRRRFRNHPFRYAAIAWSICLLLPLPQNISTAMAGDKAEILRYQALDALRVDVGTSPAAIGKPDLVSATTVTFESLGRVFVIDLVRNDRLVASLRSQLSIRDDQLKIYKGSIRGVPDSWARLSIDRYDISGAIWDGSELLLIDLLSRFEGEQLAPGKKDRLALVRLVDIRLHIDSRAHPAMSGMTVPADPLLREATSQARVFAAGAGITSRAISLGVVIGTSLANSISPVEQAAIGWTNVADGIFTAQADLHLDLDYLLNLQGMSDPFTSTNPNVLLSTLADFKSSNLNLRNLGLAHLLTRNDLDGETRGIALLSSACGPATGVSLTEARGSSIDALIMAHEIAHNLGAPHDNEVGSACASTPDGFLMSPFLNGSSLLSACSINQIKTFLNTVSCLVPVAGSDMKLDPPVLPAQIYYRKPIDLDLYVHNIGSESVLASQLLLDSHGAMDMQIWTATGRNCLSSLTSSPLACDMKNLYAGETVRINAEITPRAVGPQLLDLIASASNDTNFANNVVSLPIDVIAATQVDADGVNLTNLSTYPGGTVTYQLKATNYGDFDTMASVHLQSDPGHSLTAAANCTHPAAGQLDCDFGLLPAGESKEFELSVLVDPNLVLGLADSLNQFIDIRLDTSLYNTEMFPHLEFGFLVWGAFYDLTTGFTQLPVSLMQGESKEMIAYVTNAGPDPVADLAVQVFVQPGVALGVPVADRGACTGDAQTLNCELGQFDPDEFVTITIPYTGNTPGLYNIELFPVMRGGYNTGEVYPNAFASLNVTSATPPPPPRPQPAPETSSGGGSADWLLLLILIPALRRKPLR